MAHLRRDLASWLCSLPASVIMIVCLFLPQRETCHHNSQTPLENGTAWLLVGMAMLGVFPLLWRWRTARPAIAALAGIGVLATAISTIIGIPFIIYIALARRWATDEELVALCGIAIGVVFVVVFPLFLIFWDTARYGGTLTWLAGALELAAMVSWRSAAATRPPEPMPQNGS